MDNDTSAPGVGPTGDGGAGSADGAPVTVLVPTRNRPGLLAEALASALAQTHHHLVVLVGDDSDDDATERLVTGLDDPRIRYHRNRPGLGPQGNWLDLVARATTPLVATLHDDDRWLPSFLAETVPTMVAEPDLAMTFTDFWLIDGDGRRLEALSDAEAVRTRRHAIPTGRLPTDLAGALRLVAVWNAPQPAYAAVLRRDDVLAAEFPPSYSPLYDIWLSYQLAVARRPLRYVARRLTEYRVHGGSLTAAGFAAAEDAVFARMVREQGRVDGGAVAAEIERYWARLRWWRGTRLMADDEHDRVRSQRELLAAAPSLDWRRRVLAATGGRSSLVWHGLRHLRSARHRLGPA